MHFVVDKKKKYHYVDGYLANPRHPITVNLIGCGGTGSQFLTALAKIHVSLIALGHPGLMVTAYDGDKVEESNIGRQPFSKADIGVNKAVLMITRINRFFSLDWIAQPHMIDGRTSAEKLCANITVTCVDTGKARVTIGKKLCVKNKRDNSDMQKLYWLDFGNAKESGQVVLGTLQSIQQPEGDKYEKIPELPTIVDLHPDLASYDKKSDQGPSCSTVEALEKQDLFINPAVVTFGATLLWKMFRNYRLEFHGAYINLADFNINPIPV